MNVFTGRRAKPLVLAHRGAHQRHVENTIAAFDEGMRQGADGVELDVRLTKTGEVIVFHDDDLARLAGRPERIADCSYDLLRGIDTFEIPLLHDVLDVVLGARGVVNVEVKQDRRVPRTRVGRAVAAVLRSRSVVERNSLVLSTFDAGLFVALRAMVTRVPIALLWDREHHRAAHMALPLLRPDGVHPHWSLLDARVVEAHHARGLFVNTWTVDDPAVAARLHRVGVDGIITNDVPAILRSTDSVEG